MSNQLKMANETIACLTAKLNDSNHQHAIHIQSLHERHEQKITKIKQDIERYLNQFNSNPHNTLLEKIILEKNRELEDQQKIFNSKMSKMREKFDEK